jgi:diguanylate cyclase (GGDEF)-like protein
VRHHPVAGVEMLADIDFPWDVRPIVESHHERWDGKGYPHGIAGDAIPLTARILCVADVYDALTSARSYKPPLAHDAAMKILREEAGRQFDPALVALFDAMLGEGEPREARVQAAGTEAAAGLEVMSFAIGPRDDLTGLPLRRNIADAATATLRRELAMGGTVGLLVLDVDHFKLVNDTYGHLQGDDVLRAVVSALQSVITPGQLLGRYAGDEFVVLAPGIDAAALATLAERLRVAVDAVHVPLREAPERRVPASVTIGAAVAPAHGEAYDALFDAADRALYVAKRQGRNSVAMAGSSEVAPGQPRLQIERFVGRIAERRTLARLLEASSEGSPAMAAVSGEAGVGKSTLVRQLAPEVRLRGGLLVVGRAAEADLKPPYGPWAEIIGALHRQGAVPGRTWQELPLLVPALGSEAAAGGSPRGRYALLDEIVEYLRAAAAAAPLVLVLDDMQWADAASWDTLEHLAGQLERDRILVCLTIRAEEAGPETIARRRSLSRDERFHELTLRRLGEDDLRDWLGAIFRRNETGDALLPYLYRQSEGNPLVVVQLLRALLEEDAIHYQDGRWQLRAVDEVELPVGITDLVARRLERVSPESRRILATAAVIGRTFDVDLLVAASADDEDEVLDAVDEGVRASVLEPGPTRDGDRYTFAHGLLVEAIRESANARRLRRDHGRVAAALEARSGSTMADIARHYEKAGEDEKAYHFALRAGEQASTLYAQGEAEAFFAMAERLAADGRALVDARLRRARVLEAAGRYADAEALYEQVLAAGALADPARDAELRRAGVRVRALCGEPPPRTLAACRDLLAAADAGGLAAERVALTTMLSLAHGRMGEREAAETHARRAVELARALGDPRMLADALVRVGTALLDRAPAEAIETYRAAYEHFATLDDRLGQVRCHINSGIAHSRVGDEVAAAESYLAGHTLGVSAHAPDLAGLAALNLGVLHLIAGRYDEARERFTESLRLFTTCRSEPHRLAALYNLAHLAREARQPREAAELYQSAVELARQLGQVDVEVGAVAGLGIVGRQLGRLPVALGAQQEAARLLSARGEWWFQGRELAEALDILLLLTRQAPEAAMDRLARVAADAVRLDRYAAAWHVAECAGPIAEATPGVVRALAAEYLAVARTLRCAPLEARLEALAAAPLEARAGA